MDGSLEMHLVDNERRLVEHMLSNREPVLSRAEVEEDGEELVVSLPENRVESFLSLLRLYSGLSYLPRGLARTAASMRENLEETLEDEDDDENPLDTGVLGPSLTYAANPAKPKRERFRDDTEFDLSTCNQGAFPRNKYLDVALEDQGVDPPPWARFPEIFNCDLNAEGLPQEELEQEVVRGVEFRPRAVPLAIAANPLAAKPLIEAHHRNETIGEGLTVAKAAELFGINTQNLLNSNPKLSKGGKKCFVSAGLSLAPWGTAGIANLCPYASKGCSAGCLNISGRAEMGTKTKFATEIEARRRRTVLFYNNKQLFAVLLERAIKSWVNTANQDPRSWGKTKKKALGYSSEDACSRHANAFRMNVLSDLNWIGIKLPFGKGEMTVFEAYSGFRFYDYTKDPRRMKRFLSGPNWPDNYYLTFSWSEINAPFAFSVLDHGGNVALPFDLNPKLKPKPELPKEWCGYPVIDADVHDLRFLDVEAAAALRQKYGTGVICGLRIKGESFEKRIQAAKDMERREGLPPGTLTGGFIQYGDEAGVYERHYDPSRNTTMGGPVQYGDRKWPSYKAMLFELSKVRAEEQERDPSGWKGHGFNVGPSWEELSV